MQELGLCLAIYIGKILEIAILTVRTTLSTRGEKFWVTLLGILNNAIGLVLVIFVVIGISESPYRALAYALGEATGTYFGMILDKKLAIGSNIVTIIVDKSFLKKISTRLINEGFEITTLIGKGLKEERAIIKVSTNRRKEANIKKILEEENAKAVIFESKLLNIKNKKLKENVG